MFRTGLVVVALLSYTLAMPTGSSIGASTGASTGAGSSASATSGTVGAIELTGSPTAAGPLDAAAGVGKLEPSTAGTSVSMGQVRNPSSFMQSRAERNYRRRQQLTMALDRHLDTALFNGGSLDIDPAFMGLGMDAVAVNDPLGMDPYMYDMGYDLGGPEHMGYETMAPRSSMRLADPPGVSAVQAPAAAPMPASAAASTSAASTASSSSAAPASASSPVTDSATASAASSASSSATSTAQKETIIGAESKPYDAQALTPEMMPSVPGVHSTSPRSRAEMRNDLSGMFGGQRDISSLLDYYPDMYSMYGDYPPVDPILDQGLSPASTRGLPGSSTTGQATGASASSTSGKAGQSSGAPIAPIDPMDPYGDLFYDPYAYDPIFQDSYYTTSPTLKQSCTCMVT